MSSFPRSRIDRSTSRGTPSTTRPSPLMNIPDIRLVPPSESHLPETVPMCDAHGDLKLKMADILGRLQTFASDDARQTSDLVTLPGRYSRRLTGANEAVISPGCELIPSNEDMRTRETDLSTALKWIRQEIQEDQRAKCTANADVNALIFDNSDVTDAVDYTDGASLRHRRSTFIARSGGWAAHEAHCSLAMTSCSMTTELHMKQQDTCLLRQFAHLHDSILQLRGLYDMHSSCSDVSSLDGSTYSLNEQARSPRLHRLVLDSSHYSSKPSVSLPSSPQVSRFKWGGQDIV